jgi:hypothetical protein
MLSESVPRLRRTSLTTLRAEDDLSDDDVTVGLLVVVVVVRPRLSICIAMPGTL